VIDQRPSGGQPTVDPAAVGGGVFILPNGHLPTSQITLRGTGLPDHPVSASELPQQTPVTVTAQDDGPADQSSPAGQRLHACLAAADPPMPDIAFWTPGASAQLDATHSVQLGRRGDTLVSCVGTGSGEDQLDVLPTEVDTTRDVQLTRKVPKADPKLTNLVLYFGLITNAKAAEVTLSRGDGPDSTATVVHGTVVLTGAPLPTRGAVHITVRDAAGATLNQFDAVT
jgi:hypothetical protein